MFIWRVLRRLLAQIIRLLLLNRAVTVGLVAVLIVAFVIAPLLSSAGSLPGGLNQANALGSGQPVQAASSTGASSAPAAASSQATSNQALPQDPAVQTYLKGMLSFDANTMWTALHPQFRAQLQQNGVTLDTMKQQVAQEAQQMKYNKVFYVGSFEGQSGFKYYFYVVTFTGTDSSGQTVNSEYAYTFTVAPDGGGIYNIARQ